MPTVLYKQVPWDGGWNTTDDESTIAPAQVVTADNIVTGTKASRTLRDGINGNWDDQSNGTVSILAGIDYWYGAGTSRTQKIVSVGSTRGVYSLNSSGARSTITDAGTAWSGTLTDASLVVFNNKCIITVSGSGNVPKYWDGTSSLADLPGTPPEANFFATHQGRLWCDNRNTRDRIFYSPVSDHTLWNGAGDSGAIDVGIGDGDPDGITAVWSFRGDLFVAKRTKLYRGVGTSPDDMQFQLVSSALGCVGHHAVAVLEDDVYFVSNRGVHSLSTTASYGDYLSEYASKDIQYTFNNDLTKGRFKYIHAAYLPELNSIAFSVTEDLSLNRLNTTSGVNNAVYLFNVPRKSWYRWPDVACQCIFVVDDADMRRWYFGTHVSRLSKSLNNTAYDINRSGTHVAISQQLESPLLFLSGNPWETLAFKRFMLFYKPRGKFNATVNIRIDDQPLDPDNSLSFSSTGSGTPLGVGFTLGSTALGGTGTYGPQIRTINGIGRGCKISVNQADLSGSVEIQGFAVEFESAGTGAESVPIT